MSPFIVGNIARNIARAHNIFNLAGFSPNASWPLDLVRNESKGRSGQLHLAACQSDTLLMPGVA